MKSYDVGTFLSTGSDKSRKDFHRKMSLTVTDVVLDMVGSNDRDELDDRFLMEKRLRKMLEDLTAAWMMEENADLRLR